MLVVANFGVSIAMTYLFGGLAESGTNFIWGFVGVRAAVVVFRDRRGAIWLAVFVVLVILTPILVEDVEPRYDLPDAAATTAANLAIVGVFVFVILLYFIRQRDALHDESEALLRNVLPDEIADRLRRSGGMIADYFEEASILFADVVDFTPMSAEMTPAETVELLNEIFSFFDELVDEAGLEKIKTVGDEYMVAAGVPHPNPNHAHALADLALAIRDHTESNEVQGRRISFRIGINSGPVVAGIIGQKKFTYDLWGDSVNTASRMESHGVGGKIQISELTYGILQDDFVCEPRGEIEVKGKGRVAVWSTCAPDAAHLEQRRNGQLARSMRTRSPRRCGARAARHRMATPRAQRQVFEPLSTFEPKAEKHRTKASASGTSECRSSTDGHPTSRRSRVSGMRSTRPTHRCWSTARPASAGPDR
jgi:guanylate cyclase